MKKPFTIYICLMFCLAAVLFSMIGARFKRLERKIDTLFQRTLDLQQLDNATIERVVDISSNLTELAKLSAEFTLAVSNRFQSYQPFKFDFDPDPGIRWDLPLTNIYPLPDINLTPNFGPVDHVLTEHLFPNILDQ